MSVKIRNPEHRHFIYIDLETTGLPNYKDRIYPGIVEIGALDSQSPRFFQSLVNPGNIEISSVAKSIHGYSNSLVQTKDKLPIVWQNFKFWLQEVCQDKTIVLLAYNGKKFDFEIIKADLSRYDIKLESDWLFSDLFLHISHVFKPYVYNKEILKLDYLIEKLNQNSFQIKHNAVDDCKKLKILHQDLQENYGLKNYQNELYFPIAIFDSKEIFVQNQKLLIIRHNNQKREKIIIKGFQLNKNQFRALTDLSFEIKNSLVDDYNFDYLVYDQKTISHELLVSINLGKKIVSKKWIDHMIEHNKQANYENFLFDGKNLEDYQCDLQNSVQKARQKKGFLQNVNYFFLLSSESLWDVRYLIESGEGTIITQEDKLLSSQKVVMVAEDQSQDEQNIEYIKQGYIICKRHQIYQSCLNQKLYI